MTTSINRITIKTSFGTNLSVIVAGEKQRPAILLIHGFPNSANGFRDVIPGLAQSAYVIAPDLPAYGQSEKLPVADFDAYTKVITELLDHLEVGSLFIYLHDFGAVPGIRLAMSAPERVLGLIIQNANVHRTGCGPKWNVVFEYYANPNPQNEAASMVHLTFKGTRDQYIAGVPEDVAKHISPAMWEEDWRVMSLPGHLDVQRKLITDYSTHVAQFDAISAFLRTHQPPALLLWGRHDAFFEIAEILSWMEDLPRMEAHIFDAGHLMLETHAAPATALIKNFIASVKQ